MNEVKKKSRARASAPKVNDNVIESAASTLSEAERLASIRTRAYELYVARGRADGHDADDWVQAESEIDQLLNRHRNAVEEDRG